MVKHSSSIKVRKHSGKGTIHYTNNNAVYEGEFKDAEPHGEGKMTYVDGRVRTQTIGALAHGFYPLSYPSTP